MRRSTFFILSAIILLLYAGLALGDARVSIPWCDEAWIADAPLTFLRTGILGTPVLTPFAYGPPQSLPKIDRLTYWVMPLHLLLQVAWYKLFGFSLFAMRSLSVLWGGVAVCLVGAFVILLTGNRRAGVLAMLLTGTDYYILTRAADGRMDMMAAALELGAFAVYLWRRSKSLLQAFFFAGLLAAASAFTHPVGGFLALCGLACLVLYFDRGAVRLRHLLLFAAPYMVFGFAWGAYITQDFPTFLTQFSGNAAGRLDALRDPLHSLWGELRFKYFQAFGLNVFGSFQAQHLRLLVLFTYLAGIVMAWRMPVFREQPGVRILVILTTVNMIACALFDGAKRWYYIIHIAVLFTALLAVCIEWLWRTQRLPRTAVAVGLFALLFLQLGGTLYRIRKDDYDNQFLSAVRFIEEHGGKTEIVSGSGELGFPWNFPANFLDDISLGYYSGRIPEVVFAPEAYWQIWMLNMKNRKPDVAEYVNRLLAQNYRLAYERGPYRVYLRKH